MRAPYSECDGNNLILGEISGSHCGEYGDGCFLGYCTV
jgi:hypothetical protein